jgi:nicotinic acid phosphoribosyltransferase
MKRMRGTTEFNVARRWAAESIGAFEHEVQNQIKDTEEQEEAVRRIITYFPNNLEQET